MRIFSTLIWGLVCLSAVGAGGYLASQVAGERSESWSAANASSGQALAPPRTQFLAVGQTALAKKTSTSETSLALGLAAATKSQDAAASSPTLTLANFNEDDRLGFVATSGPDVPKIQVPASIASPTLVRATQGLNRRAPVLSLPSAESLRSAGAPRLVRASEDASNGRQDADNIQFPQAPRLALASATGLDSIPQGVGLAALASDSGGLRGLEAQGKSVSLSLFGYSQPTKIDSDDPTPSSKATSKPDAAASKKPAADTPIPSWAEIDPSIQVASLSDAPGLTPGFKHSKSEAPRNSFPRLDVSVALYNMDEPLPESQTADRILVEKGARLLHLIDGDQLVKSYRIDLGFSPVGHKLAEGDGKTPEGDYRIDWRKRDSDFYRALHISYPSEQDASIAKFSGRDPGGAIMIHGRPNGFSDTDPLAPDWTAGCIAVKNAHIEEIWAAIDDGAAIRIRP